MTAESLERIGGLLGEVGSSRVFSARRTATVDDLHLAVEGVGRLRLPVSEKQAERLCRIARPARYGQGEKTLLDRRVRDTWEVPKRRVKIDGRRWNRTLLTVLASLRADLGLPEGCRLKAELHAMLVYAPGQFFLPHQDSEKADDMVGTLLVMLPASFKGGAFVVEHQGERVTYRGSKQRLSFVAFFADCRHEVEPVKAGYRIVLTYNLLLDGPGTATEASSVDLDPTKIDAVAKHLREHFETPLPAHRFARQQDAALRDPPSRLVYLLDHQYTERGLAWRRLKGHDVARAATLRAAAERFECELVLALAEIHETWSCLESDWESGQSRNRYWERDEEDDWVEEAPPMDGPDAYQLEELIDRGITLNRWVEPSGKKATPIVAHVVDEEVCSTTPSSALEPYASEYEGYMGNYGNTLDRWYRRAAVVVWPRQRAFAVRAEASPAWALGQLQQRIRTGRLADAGKMAAALSAFWKDVVPREKGRSLLDKALRAAEGLESSALAESLLLPFRVEALTARQAPALVALVKRYGEDWVGRLLSAWPDSASRRRWASEREDLDWIVALPQLCEALLAADAASGSQTARTLLRNRWAHLREEIEDSSQLRPPSSRQTVLARLSGPILGILDGSEVAQAGDLRDEVVSFLCAAEDEARLSSLIQVLRAAAKPSTSTIRASSAIDSLRRHCVHLLQARLARPERAADDWSLPLPAGCRCKLCAELEAFLSDSGHEHLEWPLAKESRRHVHGRLEADELPVRHETRRSGRPYALMLRKTREPFEREARERLSWRADLDWLVAAGSGARVGRPRRAKRKT